jgi:transposase
MIEPDKRNAIYQLYKEGLSIRKISKQLNVSRHTVRRIIQEKGCLPQIARKDKIEIDSQLLRRIYNECGGWRERIWEKLLEEEGIKIGYSTLTRLLRDFDFEGNGKGKGKGKSKRSKRSIHVPDKPGLEMQHDTSPYRLKINDYLTSVIASLLYFRYSKMRYLKFYRFFNRFNMKCFFHEALTFFGYSASQCIIDNTNLARLRGSGANAVIIDEMSRFARQYGFEFICHEIGHANRKAGNERSFYTLESNFFPGRRFDSLEDLNRQALEWSTKRMANRPVSKSNLLPAAAFEFEKSHLIKLPPYIHPPYQVQYRLIDQYGYISFSGNYFWVPEVPDVPDLCRQQVKVLQYSDAIEVYHRQKLLVRYPLPPEGFKNQKFTPPGKTPKHQPNNRKKPTAKEENKLRSLSPEVNRYLDFVFNPSQKVAQKHRFIRQLYGLYRKLAPNLFIKTIHRALTYRITDVQIIEQMAAQLFKEGNYPKFPMSPATVDEDFIHREAYLEGCTSDEPDLDKYDQLLEEEEMNDE